MVVLSNTFGRPGNPGTVQVSYENNLRKGARLRISVGSPGIGGEGGPVAHQFEPEPDLDNLPDTAADFSHRGGAGGGRENLPLIEALSRYAELIKGTEREPLCFMEPGEFEVEWPYDTATATVVIINPGGGGGGGTSDIQPGEYGENGMPGATFVFPTYIPVQRPT